LIDSENLFIFKNNEEGDKIRKRRALIVETLKRMKASEALRLRKQRSINYKVMPLDWWERQKRLPDFDEEGLVLLKKQDYLESIRPFGREIFKKREPKFWKVDDFFSF
jgi:hypothetical protein